MSVGTKERQTTLTELKSINLYKRDINMIGEEQTCVRFHSLRKQIAAVC